MANYGKTYQNIYSGRETSAITCTALILLDSNRIRRKAIGSLKRSRTAYSKAEKEWEFFLDEENPAFKKWINSTFGSQLTQCRELHEEIQYISMLIDKITYENYITGDPYDICYDRVMDRIKNPEKYQHEEGCGDPFEQNMNGEPTADNREDNTEEIDEEFAQFDACLNDVLNAEDDRDDACNAVQAHRKYQIKQVYRDLARRIHPDSSGEMSPKIQNLWYAVQDAYNNEDLEQLEVLQAHLDLFDGHIAETSTFFHIKELTMRFRHALKSLRATINKARKEPAWGFLSLSATKRASMKMGVAKAFDDDIYLLAKKLSFLEDRLDLFKTPF